MKSVKPDAKTPTRRTTGAKTGDPEGRRRYVALYMDELDSMAGKTLSPAALWLLVQIRKAWRGDNHNLELPFARVSWKLAFKVFDRARRELVDAGFVDIVDPGGLSYGAKKNPAMYALSDRWKEVSKKLMDDLDAMYEVRVPLKAGGSMSVWYPKRKRSESQQNADRARMAKMKNARRTKTDPGKRVLEILKSPDDELGKAVTSIRRRLRNTVAHLEREGHG